MTELHAADVDALARLARLTLSDEDRVTFVRQLGDILRYLDAIASVDVDGVAPWQPPAPTAAPLREDVARAPLAVDDALRGVPAAADGLVIVPRFVES